MTGVIHIVLARKPLSEGTVVENCLKYGTGALNIDGCRIKAGEMPKACKAPGWDSINSKNADAGYRPGEYNQGGAMYKPNNDGRFPSNIIHDGSGEIVRQFPDSNNGHYPSKSGDKIGFNKGGKVVNAIEIKYGSGSASRFFYEAGEYEEV